MADQTDKDKDGLYDWLETKGIMATNGRVYYSDTGSGDGDTDGVSDLIEQGTIYIIIYRSDGNRYIYLDNGNGRLDLDDECVYESKDATMSNTSKYLILKSYVDLLKPGQARFIVCARVMCLGADGVACPSLAGYTCQ